MHPAADRIRAALSHFSHGKPPVEAEAVATQIAPGVLVKVEGVKGAAEAGLEVTEHGVDPERNCGRTLGCLSTVTIA